MCTLLYKLKKLLNFLLILIGGDLTWGKFAKLFRQLERRHMSALKAQLFQFGRICLTASKWSSPSCHPLSKTVHSASWDHFFYFLFFFFFFLRYITTANLIKRHTHFFVCYSNYFSVFFIYTIIWLKENFVTGHEQLKSISFWK